MTTKAVAHTPGPWGYLQKEGPRPTTLLRRHWEIGQSGPERIGVAIAFGPEREGDEPPTDANARLIAAAPELLEAAQQTVCMSCGYKAGEPGIEFHHQGSCSTCADLRAAIAKATVADL